MAREPNPYMPNIIGMVVPAIAWGIGTSCVFLGLFDVTGFFAVFIVGSVVLAIPALFWYRRYLARF